MSNNCSTLGRRGFFPVAVVLLWLAPAICVRAQAITNLLQLTQTLNLQQRAYRDVNLEVTVCAASRPQLGVLIVQDESGAELLEIGSFDRDILPGARIVIKGRDCLLRKRGLGVEISPQPVVDNDGLHPRRTATGAVALKAGLNPLRVDWFGYLWGFNLEVSYVLSNGPPDIVNSTNLFHAVVDESGRTNFLPSLSAEAYEGYWENAPDFDLLQPARTGIATNFDLGFRTREESVGLRFTGYFNAPCAGQYTFMLRSSEGSLLFLGDRELTVARVGVTNVPGASRGLYGGAVGSPAERRWTTIAGRVSRVLKKGEGLEFELHSDRNAVSVGVADSSGLDPARLLNARLKVTGVGCGVMTADQRIVLGRLLVANTNEIVVDEQAGPHGELPMPITSVAEVQSLRIEDARHALPVRIRGVVTVAKNSRFDRWMSIQDDTRGVFVNLSSISNAVPAFGEYWEVEGHSGAGNFAPIIIADKLTLLGDGRLPEPARPTWTELLNGSMDVQWAELQGLVTDVQDNTMTLLLPEGRLEVQMDGYHEPQLKPFVKTVARIRGVLYAVWNPETREVRVGSVLMRNATISVDVPAPADPFDAVVKTPRELLLFDTQATAFRRVKVRGQILYADATQLFLDEDGTGLRLLPSEKNNLRPGDLVEAVGYPDISRTALLLREVILRKTGEAALPAAKKLAESELTQENLDSTRVRIEGQLLGWHFEQGAPVLEMQSGAHLYLARLVPGTPNYLSLRPGSRLALTGVFVGRGHNQLLNPAAESFDLLLNSSADVVVLSQPPWWTLQKLLIIVGMLLAVLAVASVWITQLRRLVEKRTAQLQREIREREQVERRHALEAERSRIARDLHDDLGSSLTEISVLASTGLRQEATAPQAGQRPQAGEAGHANLFRSIAGKARGLIAALDVIVWAVDPEDNSLQSLADYLTGYAAEFFSHTNVSCRFKVPVAFPPITLEGRVRHELLMAVKETLNNIVRHAEATEVEFRMAFSNDILEIEAADNGKGFEGVPEKDRRGLRNLPARLKQIGGDCTVESRLGGGTTVKIRLALPAGAKNAAQS
jgi:signal transduction histidine kinase